MATTKTKTKEKELELSPFANNGHATEYTKMMHRINDNLNMYINDHLRMYTSDYALI